MQREHDPDVNTFDPDPENEDVEQPVSDGDGLPLPPDVEKRDPVEDPPYGEESPVGDDTDHPARIVDDREDEDSRF